MSIKVMTLVWENYPGNGSELLTMLALADWCNDSGGSLHPSIKTISEKVRLSEKQARRIVHTLIENNWLSVVGNEHGGNPGDSRHYQMNVKRLTTPADVTPPMGVTPPAHVPYPSHGCPSTPPTHGSLTVIEPLRTVIVEQPKKKTVSRAKNKTALPTNWQPNEKHKEMALTFRLNIETECRKFMDHHEAKGSLFASWDAAFRTWLANAAEWNKDKQPQQPPRVWL